LEGDTPEEKRPSIKLQKAVGGAEEKFGQCNKQEMVHTTNASKDQNMKGEES